MTQRNMQPFFSYNYDRNGQKGLADNFWLRNPPIRVTLPIVNMLAPKGRSLTLAPSCARYVAKIRGLGDSTFDFPEEVSGHGISREGSRACPRSDRPSRIASGLAGIVPLPARCHSTKRSSGVSSREPGSASDFENAGKTTWRRRHSRSDAESEPATCRSIAALG